MYTRGEKANLEFLNQSLKVQNIENMGFPGGSNGKESACSAGDSGSIPGSGRSLGEENGNPLQYSCLENPMNRGEEPGRLQSIGSQRIGHDWLNNTHRKHIAQVTNEKLTVIKAELSAKTLEEQVQGCQTDTVTLQTGNELNLVRNMVSGNHRDLQWKSPCQWK